MITMKKILISINPEYVEKILSGEKKFEYRTRVAKQDINSIIIYSTYPTKRIVAEAEIVKILETTPDDLWSQTKDYSGIDKMFFDSYFENRKKAYAYVLGKVTKYKKPLQLGDFGVRYAPQSYMYI